MTVSRSRTTCLLLTTPALFLFASTARGQVTAELHTASRPQVVRPEDGERRILPDDLPESMIFIAMTGSSP